MIMRDFFNDTTLTFMAGALVGFALASLPSLIIALQDLINNIKDNKGK